VNLETVKEEVDQGVTDPHVIFSDNSVESVVEAWATLRAKGTESLFANSSLVYNRRLCTTAEQRKSHDELYE